MERLRRLRRSAAIRDMVRETHLRIDELVYPVFVAEGIDEPRAVESMPGVFQEPLSRVPELADAVASAGIKAVLLFGIPLRKDETGSAAFDNDGIVPRAIRAIKSRRPEIVVIADTCLCEYTSHGHCGLVEDGAILNDETLPVRAKAAVAPTDSPASR